MCIHAIRIWGIWKIGLIMYIHIIRGILCNNFAPRNELQGLFVFVTMFALRSITPQV